MLDLFFLNSFVAIAKTHSFLIAAERNHITQPAVSQHIKVLEKKLGAALFERHGKKVTLTHAGKIFLPYAENILKTYEEAKTRVGESDNTFSGTIHIATIYSIGLYNLRSALQKFVKKYPQIHLQLEYQQSSSIYEKAINQTIDFGLVAYPEKRPGIAPEIFIDDELVLVQSTLHRTLDKKHVPMKSLDNIKYISFSPTTPTGKMVNQFFSKNKIRPRITQEYDNVELIKSAALLGLGCALLPRSTIARELKERALEIIHVEGLKLKRSIGVLYHKNKVFTKSARVFYDTLMAQNQNCKEHALLV